MKTKLDIVRKEIKNIQTKLINSAKKSGLTENFGQADVSALMDKYSDYQFGDTEEQLVWRQIQHFDEWCMDYDGH